ncbi:hypothetical protein SERLA73DRAFT_162035 [Serpula lacrymans var. lacrymans S7.3]|uniref:Asl1-like glycosyl hydrolase catalytic domain-containing protein n=2 Tax=Serpula lacrymans var. lacrymans TaxID=341189 RepID=F8Q645_SERL3|nr:uncharacterized protein SERLADRAFT_417129 [Serpula lacrymans var. lacrymans S7.9]EGN96083.1 hypothetical protein SERLA73DRAFT_162035 [Serpula lacrymans var. lacrymans S7.3]EGO21604.1 hypothetical protein SERLADRAFT_417129 [Serpula lacrymans var. lacrymans S7.9]
MFSLAALSLLALVLVNGTNASNSKRGLAFADNTNPTDISVAENTEVSWVYDWGTTPASYIASSGLPYIPMQWGTSGVESFAATVTSQGAKTILGFNEPDLSSQSNVDPSTAASLWTQYIQPLKAQGVTLGAPAVTNGPTGIPWLQQFLGNCSSCDIDFVPLHWYGEGVSNFESYVEQFHSTFPSYPLWVTEFASTSTNSTDVETFLTAVLTWLDAQSYITGYAWFALFRDDGTSYYSLLNSSGQPNALGTSYFTQA